MLISIGVLISSCRQGSNESSNTVKQKQSERDKLKYEANNTIDANETNGVQNLKKVMGVGLTKNGINDSLVLSVSATKNENDEIIWDDSQTWKVHLKSESVYSLIYEKDIQLGKLELYLDRSKNLLFLVENAPYQKFIYEINLSESDLALNEIEKLPEISNYESITFE